MMQAVAVTDLHGNISLYELLFRVADLWKLTSIFITGDLAPSAIQGRLEGNEDRASDDQGMVVQKEFFTKQFIPLCSSFLLEHRHTDMYVIMGNDDRRANERLLEDFNDEAPNFHLVNDRLVALRDSHQKQTFFPGEVPRLWVAGYPYVPPGGSLLMDWVKYENRVKLRPIGMDSTTDIYEMGITTDAKGHGSTIAEDLEDFGTYLRKSGRTDEGISYDPLRRYICSTPPPTTPPSIGPHHVDGMITFPSQIMWGVWRYGGSLSVFDHTLFYQDTATNLSSLGITKSISEERAVLTRGVRRTLTC